METTYYSKLISFLLFKEWRRMNDFYSLRSMAIFLTKNLVNDSFYFCISLFLIDC